MGALSIKLAESKILQHLQLGGQINDNIGTQLVQAFTQKVFRESNIKQICENNGFTPTEIEAVINSMTKELMPNPAINSGGILLVTTLMFMEPKRLEELLTRINSYTESETLSDDPATNRATIIATQSAMIARLVWDNHTNQRGEQPFHIQDAGGLKSAGGGCATLFVAGGFLVVAVERVFEAIVF